MAHSRTYYRLRRIAASLVRSAGAVLGWDWATTFADRMAFVRSNYGPHLLITPGDRTFELCVHGYGRFVADAIAGQDKPFAFLDIGANLGLFSLLAARTPHCRRAVAIEPLPAIFRNLEANIRHNGSDRITALRGALHSGGRAQVNLTFNPAHSGMSKVVEAGGIPVPVLSAGRLDRAFAGNTDRILVKIDVEGSEIDVLAVLRTTQLYAAVDELIIEVSEENLGIPGCARLLQLLGEDGFVELSRAGKPRHYDARYRRDQDSARQESQPMSRPG